MVLSLSFYFLKVFILERESACARVGGEVEGEGVEERERENPSRLPAECRAPTRHSIS